ncbi:Hsp90 co-chaperone AHA1 [Candida viswanathii]|uniref:Hsp90 co-chaperone AHA1 n=1 Tax=Candida viswanathii TaxID=5486 RepID=A0A367YJG0_9ASCO|nr:Hsp90 co-chaperone AHA1 [Candida viswanathii]
MVVNNPNNWHWVDKNCFPWAVEYFDKNLVGLDAISQDEYVHIEAVSSVEGDVDVSQRKGKVISLFDVRLVLTWHGYSPKAEDINGSITIPELTYDSEEDDLQFQITVYNENAQNTTITGFIKKHIIPKLRKKLMQFGKDLIETNSKDIQLSQDKVTSSFTKANQSAETPAEKPREKKEEVPKKESPAPAEKKAETAKAPSPQLTQKDLVSDKISNHKKVVYADGSTIVPKYNTTTLHLEPEFNTTAEQLYITLLLKERISAWTRSFPVIENFPPKEGTDFELFGGSVSGKILKLVPNELIIELWRLLDWKEGHFAQLDIKLVQGGSETTMVVKFSGIPIGEEERVRNNFEERYVRAIKITFGFGAVL